MHQRLPEFIGVGPPRTATTWLHEVLSGYVGLPRGVKETEFFDRHYSRGLEWHLRHFRDCPPNLPCGEFSPTYFASAQARTRIAADLPNCKIIITLRDPVERFYSHYRLLRREGWLRDETLEQAIACHLRNPTCPGNMFYVSRYAEHVRAWQSVMRDGNVKVMLCDDLQADSQSFIARVCSFLEIPEFDLSRIPAARQRINTISRAPKSRRLAKLARRLIAGLRSRGLYGLVNSWDRTWLWRLIFESGKQFHEMTPAQEANLRERFRSEIEQLEVIIQRDLSKWKREAAQAGADHEQVLLLEPSRRGDDRHRRAGISMA